MSDFIEIEHKERRQKAIYRFYGRGRWEIKSGTRWATVNAIYVPGPVLSVAAQHCQPSSAPECRS